MKRIKRIFGISIPERWLFVPAVLLFVILLIPIIRLAFYAIPWYDDYSYAVYVKSHIDVYGPLKGAILGAMYVARTWWYCWQGTFSSIVMMSIMPEAFGEGYYYVGIIGIVLFFCVSSLCFVKTICKHFMKAQYSIQISVAVLVTLTMIELIYTAQEGIYWYNAAVHYTFMHGCLFLLLTSIIKGFYARTRMQRVCAGFFAALLSLVCGGSNFVTALQGILLILFATTVGFLLERKSCIFLLPADIIYTIALYFNISAPGNAVRSAWYNGYGALESILYSFKSGAVHFWEFTGSITIVILVPFVLMIWNSISRLEYKFRCPLLVTIFSFCFYCTGFTSSYYGMG
ncbi:MAG: hypothetical protein IJZ82_09655 [Lachnospiraceae bacterium]|nr:hypothetical protein [Lachnospiraceae bacterium]